MGKKDQKKENTTKTETPITKPPIEVKPEAKKENNGKKKKR